MDKIINERTEIGAFVEAALLDSFSKIFRVNLNTGEYEVYKHDGLLDGDDFENVTDIYDYMQRLVDEGIVYPEYVTACRRFTNPEYVRKSVFSGDKRIVQSYRRRTSRGDKWVTFAIISMEGCGPENPMVLFTWRAADSDTITLLDTLPTISSLYDKLIRINLSNNTYEPVIVDADEQERLVGGVINMYEWWAGYSKDGNIASEDMSAFGTLTKSGSLQKRFAEDPTPVSFRYRRKVGDEFRWVQLQISPSVEYSEENQIMLLSLKDVHEEYTAQLKSRQELIDNMNRDALTNLSNRLKFNEDIEKLTKSDGTVFTCLYIDVNGLHELNNLLGHQKGDDMLCCVADTLKAYFAEENVYRIGGDEFVVTSTRLPKDEVEGIVAEVRRELLKFNYEISIGIESGACGENVERIVATAEQNMRDDKAAYYMHNGDRRRRNQLNEELEHLLEEKRDNERFLDLITSQFAGVYFVDFDRDVSRHICGPEFFAKFLEECGNSFKRAIRIYVDTHVKSEYRSLFDNVLDYDKLDEELRDKSLVEVTYENTDGFIVFLRILEVERPENGKPETLWMFWKEQR